MRAFWPCGRTRGVGSEDSRPRVSGLNVGNVSVGTSVLSLWKTPGNVPNELRDSEQLCTNGVCTVLIGVFLGGVKRLHVGIRHTWSYRRNYLRFVVEDVNNAPLPCRGSPLSKTYIYPDRK